MQITTFNPMILSPKADEVIKLFEERGFKNARGNEHVVESKSAKSCLMISSTGFSIQLTQHIRKDEN